MADNQGARKGGDASDKETFGVKAEALRFFKDLLTEDFTDGIVQLSLDAELRNRAEDFGVKVADAGWAIPGVRNKLALVPNFLLRIGAPAFGTMIIRDMVGRRDNVAEWGREFMQGFARRVAELKASGSAPASAGTGNEAGKPNAPARPPEKSAAELIATPKGAQLLAIIEEGRLTEPALADEVQTDIYQNLNFEHELDAIMQPAPLPPAPFDTDLSAHPERLRYVAFVEREVPVDERVVALEEARKRVVDDRQLTGVLADLPVPVVAPADSPDFALIGDRLGWFQTSYADPHERTDRIRRVLPHLRDAGRTAYLFAEEVDVPAALRGTREWTEFGAVFTRVVSAADQRRLLAEVDLRVRTIQQLAGITANSPDEIEAAILALPLGGISVPTFEARLAELERLYPVAAPVAPALAWSDVRARLLALPERKARITLTLLQRRMQLIKDSRADRLFGTAFKTAVNGAQAVGRQVFGSHSAATAVLQETTARVDRLQNRLFGPRPQPGQGVWSVMRSVFARIRAAFAAFRAAFAARNTPAALPPPPNNAPNP